MLFLTSRDVSVTHNVDDSAENSQLRSDEEVFKLDVWAHDSLDENSAHFLIVHLDLVIDWEEEQSVVADDVCLGVVPLGLESVTRVFDWVSCHFQIL